ncbi:PqqD family protein [Motilibacter aurantiacus]|uniref:PqqD family protein n=1 Tax=Motilibacter aurantiacus TaxID=2714955 RepID=UPI00140C66E8|nr:PqqD family protein [Motilibacter aurantiacus]NHC45921.1 PqqD family protein [Motilibacter aurantiacus]
MRIRSEGLAARSFDAETVVLDLEKSQYLTLNETGSLLYELLRQERTMDELVDAVVAEYSVDRATALRDVEAFVAALREHGLLTESDVLA